MSNGSTDVEFIPSPPNGNTTDAGTQGVVYAEVDPDVALFHHFLGTRSPKFETYAKCEEFISALRQRGVQVPLLLKVGGGVHTADDLILRLQVVGVTAEELGLVVRTEPTDSEIQAQLDELVLRAEPAFEKLVSGKLGLTPWTSYRRPDNDLSEEILEHLDHLALPQIGRSGIPSLLLHDLGSQLNAGSQRLFSFGAAHQYFINAAGSGKTRLCLDAMCLHYAFYFTCADPRGKISNALAEVREAHEIGSCDLSNVFKTLDAEIAPPFQNLDSETFALPQNAKLRVRTSERNAAMAKDLLLSVLAARVYLFERYLHHAEKSGVVFTLQSKRAWMYLQIQPHILKLDGVDDIFETLADCLRKARPTFIQQLCKERYASISTLLACNSRDLKIPTVIDEAQQGLGQLPKAFLSSTKAAGQPLTRPLLREITGHWSNFSELEGNSDLRFVITGTGLSLSDLKAKTRSTLSKSKVWEDAEFSGSFSTRPEQSDYVRRFLPKSLLESEDGKILCERMWYWLRGRHRFTAAFIQYLLGCTILDGYRANVLLNMFIYGFGEFYPTDAMSRRYPFRFSNVRGPSLTAIEFAKLDSRCVDLLREKVYRYMLRSEKPPIFDDDSEKLLEVGLGQLTKVADPMKKKKNEVSVHEPLILKSAFTWLNQLAHRRAASDEQFLSKPLFTWMHDSLQEHMPKWNMFENMLAYYFTQVFSSSQRCKLSEIFTFLPVEIKGPDGRTQTIPFHRHFELGSCRATLISSYHQNDVHLQGHFDFPAIRREGETPGYAGTIGISAQDSVSQCDSARILAHMNDFPASILFPGEDMGPDLIFMLKLEKDSPDPDVETDLSIPLEAPTYLWVAVQAKLRTAGPLYGKELKNTIASVTPKNFFTLNFKKKPAEDGQNKKASRHEDESENRELRFKDNAAKADYQQKTLAALRKGMPEGQTTPNTGTYSLLRVVASYPFQVPESKMCYEGDSDDKHPLAVLDLDRMQSATEHLVPRYGLQAFRTRHVGKRNAPESNDTSDDDVYEAKDLNNHRPKKMKRN